VPDGFEWITVGREMRPSSGVRVDRRSVWIWAAAGRGLEYSTLMDLDL
jgi:hypothetical protein